MFSDFTFEWVFISWIISLFIHHHNIRRATIFESKDKLIELLTSLSELKCLNSDDNPLYQQERYNTHVARINWKVKQLNELASCSLVPGNMLDPLYNFDVESYVEESIENTEKQRLRFVLQECCEQVIDHIETTHFKKIVRSKVFILWSARYSLAGVLFGLVVVYLFIQILLFFYC